MSNDMNKQNRQKHEGSIDEKSTDAKIADAYEDVSKESTSSEMDAMIMAMAEKEADSRSAGKGSSEKIGQSWWHRLRLPVSITAAMVVTVGIARFMVELGYYDPNSVAYSDNNPPASYSATEIVLDDSVTDSSNPAYQAEARSKVAAAPQKAPSERSKELADGLAEVKTIQATGARIKREQKALSRERMELAKKQAFEAERRQTAALKEKSLTMDLAKPESTLLQEEQIEVDTNQEFSSDSELDVSGEVVTELPYRPSDEWIESIKQALERDDFEQAKQEWSEFQQVYPCYLPEKSLLERLEQL